MKIRLSEKADLDVIMQIIAEARASICKLGIDQWQYGYPTREIIKEDIEKRRNYVVLDGDEICATFALINDGEPSYKKIYSGAWFESDGKYLALHRIAVADSKKGKGIGKEVVDFFAEYAKKNGFTSIRVDTHTGNTPMRRMLEKNGFEYCGIIYLSSDLHDGETRVAYEKIVE